MRLLGPLLVVTALTLSAAPAFALKVGVVDMADAMQKTKHFQTAKDRLEKERAKRQTVLDQKQAVLEKQQSELQAKAAISTPESLQADQQRLMVEAQKLAQEFMVLQQELAGLEQRYTGQMLQRFQAVIRYIAIQKDIDFVLDSGPPPEPNVLYHQDPTDITEEVLAEYRKRYKDQPLELD